MKKHDEGYALVLVVVVIAVFSLIVIPSVLQTALANMEGQRDSIDRMTDKYKVQGEIEIAVAQLNAEIEAIPPEENEVKVSSGAGENNDYRVAAIIEWIKKNLSPDEADPASIKIIDNRFFCNIPLQKASDSGNTRIDFTVELSGIIDEMDSEGIQKCYKITFEKLRYSSFDISVTSEPDASVPATSETTGGDG